MSNKNENGRTNKDTMSDYLISTQNWNKSRGDTVIYGEGSPNNNTYYRGLNGSNVNYKQFTAFDIPGVSANNDFGQNLAAIAKNGTTALFSYIINKILNGKRGLKIRLEGTSDNTNLYIQVKVPGKNVTKGKEMPFSISLNTDLINSKLKEKIKKSSRDLYSKQATFIGGGCFVSPSAAKKVAGFLRSTSVFLFGRGKLRYEVLKKRGPGQYEQYITDRKTHDDAGEGKVDPKKVNKNKAVRLTKNNMSLFLSVVSGSYKEKNKLDKETSALKKGLKESSLSISDLDNGLKQLQNDVKKNPNSYSPLDKKYFEFLKREHNYIKWLLKRHEYLKKNNNPSQKDTKTGTKSQSKVGKGALASLGLTLPSFLPGLDENIPGVPKIPGTKKESGGKDKKKPPRDQGNGTGSTPHPPKDDGDNYPDDPPDNSHFTDPPPQPDWGDDPDDNPDPDSGNGGGSKTKGGNKTKGSKTGGGFKSTRNSWITFKKFKDLDRVPKWYEDTTWSSDPKDARKQKHRGANPTWGLADDDDVDPALDPVVFNPFYNPVIDTDGEYHGEGDDSEKNLGDYLESTLGPLVKPESNTDTFTGSPHEEKYKNDSVTKPIYVDPDYVGYSEDVEIKLQEGHDRKKDTSMRLAEVDEL